MGCSNCDVVVSAGDGIRVEGAGTPRSPYVVHSNLPDFGSILKVRDSQSVNLSLFGSGTVADPFTIQADATVSLTGLRDVDDPEGGPLPGEVPVWVGSSSVDGHWEFQTPPAAPAGAVIATTGLVGTGTVQSPLRVAVSGAWGVSPLDVYGSDPSVGLLVYVDESGQLRAEPPTVSGTAPGGSVQWRDVLGKPTAFPPASHTHVAADISLDEQRKLDVGKISGISIKVQATEPTNPGLNDVWIQP